MSERPCPNCGGKVPDDKNLCPTCQFVVPKVAAPAPVQAMADDVLPPGMTDAPPPPVYGVHGQSGYVPPTAHRMRVNRNRSTAGFPFWIVLLAAVAVAAIVAFVVLAG